MLQQQHVTLQQLDADCCAGVFYPPPSQNTYRHAKFIFELRSGLLPENQVRAPAALTKQSFYALTESNCYRIILDKKKSSLRKGGMRVGHSFVANRMVECFPCQAEVQRLRSYFLDENKRVRAETKLVHVPGILNMKLLFHISDCKWKGDALCLQTQRAPNPPELAPTGTRRPKDQNKHVQICAPSPLL